MHNLRMLTGQQVSVEQRSDAWCIHASLGEHSQFTMLYDRHAAALYRYAYGRVGEQYAEDLVSETFLVAFRRRRAYDPSRPNARPWLFGILTKEISRHRRREHAHYRALARTRLDDDAEDPAEQAVSLAAAHTVRAPLAAALAGLPARDRDVLLLIAWGGLSYEEAAQAAGIPIGTVRSRLHRARRKLGAALGGEDPTRVIERLT